MNNENHKPQPRIAKVIRVAVNAVLLTISTAALLAVVLIIATKINFGPYRLFVIHGGSMEPTIHFGAVVIVKTASAASVKIGDPILFEQNRGQLVHRVINIKDACIQTQGDANKDPDPSCAKNVAGIVVYGIPYLGYLFITLNFLATSFAAGIQVIGSWIS
jgi:signal peptidase I